MAGIFDLAIDNDGDLVIENNRLKTVDGKELIRQNLMKRLRTFFGEWFLNTAIGIPYFQAIFVKGIDLNEIEDIFIGEIGTTPGVVEITKFDLDYQGANRELSLDFEVKSDEGQLIRVSDFSLEV